MNPWRATRQFAGELKTRVAHDHISNGAAALGYYLTLAIFPAAVVLLSLLPYLPVANVDQAVMNALRQFLPGQAAGAFSGIVENITRNRHEGLLSAGLIGTFWAAASGTSAVMAELNIVHKLEEGRSFFREKATALGLTILLGALIVIAFALIVFGGDIQGWIEGGLGGGLGGVVPALFAAARWLIILGALFLAFELLYKVGPDFRSGGGKGELRCTTRWGSAVGVALLVCASLLFRLYVSRFGQYEKTYGSLGAAIVLMIWLFVVGFTLLFGAEVNAVVAAGRSVRHRSLRR